MKNALSAATGTVRAAVPGDAAAILALEAVFPSDRLSAAAVRRLLHSAAVRVWVVEEGSELLGNLILQVPRRWHVARIYSLAVAPAARGRGYARRLLEAAECAARDLHRCALSLEVRADNAAARALYAATGYREVAQLPAYYDDGAAGLRLRKDL